MSQRLTISETPRCVWASPQGQPGPLRPVFGAPREAPWTVLGPRWEGMFMTHVHVAAPGIASLTPESRGQDRAPEDWVAASQDASVQWVMGAPLPGAAGSEGGGVLTRQHVEINTHELLL